MKIESADRARQLLQSLRDFELMVAKDKNEIAGIGKFQFEFDTSYGRSRINIDLEYNKRFVELIEQLITEIKTELETL